MRRKASGITKGLMSLYGTLLPLRDWVEHVETPSDSRPLDHILTLTSTPANFPSQYSSFCNAALLVPAKIG